MSSEKAKILEFNQYQKSDKILFILYADLECLKKIDKSKNNPKNSYTIKVGENILSDFSMSLISLFNSTQNNHGKVCMKKFYESLKKHTMEIINFRKKKTKSSRNHTKMQKSIKFVNTYLKINIVKIKHMVMVRTIVIKWVNIELLHIVYVIESLVYLIILS